MEEQINAASSPANQLHLQQLLSVLTSLKKGDFSMRLPVGRDEIMSKISEVLNDVIDNLEETTRINTEQYWLKTNLDKFNRILKGKRDIVTVCNMILSELAPLVSMQHGVFYINESEQGEPILKLFASYGYQERKHVNNRFRRGEGLIGQCLIEKQRILLTNVPGDYIKISSGLGEATPLNIVMLPIIFDGHVLAVIEIASFRAFTPIDLEFLDQLTESIGIVLNTMQANIRTEDQLLQSQSITEQLRKQRDELRHTNERLEERARLLEVKAEQLTLTSKHKAEVSAESGVITPNYGELPLSLHTELAPADAAAAPGTTVAVPAAEHERIQDDRYAISADDRVLLIVENDPQFAETLLQAARKKGFKGIVTLSGENALELVSQFTPAAIAIDTYLGNGNGLIVLDLLKKNAASRNIPVWVMSIGSERLSFLQRGAVGWLTKPIGSGELDQKVDEMMERVIRPQRRVIVWSASGDRIRTIMSALEPFDIRVTEVISAEEFVSTARMLRAGCIVVDWADAHSGQSLLDEILRDARIYEVPLLLYTESPWMQAEDERLSMLARSFVVKKAASPQELAYEGSLFLPLKIGVSVQSLFEDRPAQSLRIMSANSKVLVIDDDIRDIFALTSLLERHAIPVISTDNAKEALLLLRDDPDIGVVLAGISMPVMNGYETIAAIRSMPKFKKLPVIALAAKAMTGDRDKYLEAGATDYMTKPVHNDELLARLHKWLRQ